MPRPVLLNHRAQRVWNATLSDSNPTENLNILILYDVYDYGSVSASQQVLWKDRTAVVRHLYSIKPFNELRKQVKVFVVKVPAPTGSAFLPTDDGFLHPELLRDFIRSLNYPSYLTAGDIWLNEELQGKPNKSYGCVGVLLGKPGWGLKPRDCSRYVPAGWEYGPDFLPPPLHPYFVVATDLPISPRKRRNARLGASFAHELGHALGLANEYESEITAGKSGVWDGDYGPFPFAPNIISKNEILKPGISLAEGELPTLEQIESTLIPWKPLKTGPLYLFGHTSRYSISEDRCPVDHWISIPIPGSTEAFCRLEDDYDYKDSNSIGASVSLTEGGGNASFDVFRSMLQCIMRNGERVYCKVCEKWIEYRITTNVVLSTDDVPGARQSFRDWLSQ